MQHQLIQESTDTDHSIRQSSLIENMVSVSEAYSFKCIVFIACATHAMESYCICVDLIIKWLFQIASEIMS